MARKSKKDTITTQVMDTQDTQVMDIQVTDTQVMDTQVTDTQVTDTQTVGTIETQIQTIEAEAEVSAPLERSNRISVVASGDTFKADFFRTHKHLKTVYATETGWEADTTSNKTSQRESFRTYIQDHAYCYGINWDPVDRRTDANARIAKYDSDTVLETDAIRLISEDIGALVEASGYAVTIDSFDVDGITPMTTTAKGADLSKLGIIDGKYEKSGNWAWAEIAIAVTMAHDSGEEIYFNTTVQLVSGQLKKPHLTKTAVAEEIKKSLDEAGLLPSEDDQPAEDKAE